MTGPSDATPDMPPVLESVRVLRLEPGDTIVAKVSDAACMDEVDQVHSALSARFPGHEVLVVRGVDLAVVREESG